MQQAAASIFLGIGKDDFSRFAVGRRILCGESFALRQWVVLAHGRTSDYSWSVHVRLSISSGVAKAGADDTGFPFFGVELESASARPRGAPHREPVARNESILFWRCAQIVPRVRLFDLFDPCDRTQGQ